MPETVQLGIVGTHSNGEENIHSNTIRLLQPDYDHTVRSYHSQRFGDDFGDYDGDDRCSDPYTMIDHRLLCGSLGALVDGKIEVFCEVTARDNVSIEAPPSPAVPTAGPCRLTP
jgi:hypothetical protein